MARKDNTEEIRHKAYALWEAEGCPDGRDHEHWQQAQEALATTNKPVPKKTGPKKPGAKSPPKPASKKTAAKS